MAKKMNVKQIKDRISHLKSERQLWMNHWQECYDYLMPRRNTVTNQKSPGTKRGVNILDATGILANELLAGALHGLLTNPDAQWFEFTTGDLDLDHQDDVRMWLQKAAMDTHHVINNSNFQTEIHESYCDLCCIGTAAMYIEEDEKDVVRFSTKFIAEFMIDENSKGFIDQIYREWSWEAARIVEEFGLDKVPQKVKDSFLKMDNTKFMVQGAVYPRDMVDPKHKSAMKFICQYTLPDLDFEIQEEGYREFPYVIPRWTKGTGEKYGRSPGMNALPEVKTLNVMTETMVIGMQKVVDPPLQLPDDGFILPIATYPGGLNFYRSGTNDQIKPVFNDSRVDFGYQALEDGRNRIKQIYYTDQLKLQQGPQMTATEVLQRTEEAMRLLGPMLGRQQSELLRPMIDRVFSIMVRRGKIDLTQIPPSLQGRKIDVRYSSLIAKSQRLADGQNIMRSMEAITPFIQLDASVADNINGDAAFKVIARTYGLAQEVIRTDDEKKTIRDARAQAQQSAMQAQERQAQIQAAPKLAETMNNLGAQIGPK